MVLDEMNDRLILLPVVAVAVAVAVCRGRDDVRGRLLRPRADLHHARRPQAVRVQGGRGHHEIAVVVRQVAANKSQV